MVLHKNHLKLERKVCLNELELTHSISRKRHWMWNYPRMIWRYTLNGIDACHGFSPESPSTCSRAAWSPWFASPASTSEFRHFLATFEGIIRIPTANLNRLQVPWWQLSSICNIWNDIEIRYVDVRAGQTRWKCFMRPLVVPLTFYSPCIFRYVSIGANHSTVCSRARNIFCIVRQIWSIITILPISTRTSKRFQ